MIRQFAMALLLGAGFACKFAEEASLPENVEDPSKQHSPAGAMARYYGALIRFPYAFDLFMVKTGILTDELASLTAPLGSRGQYSELDSRNFALALLNPQFDDEYTRFHRIRGEAREARGFLREFATDSSPALAGHLYAIEGYAEILLSDLFCSGIPLSTVDFDGSFTMAPGSSTTDVYTHAVTLFDSALAVSSDSVRFQHLAAVGRGRALLALGRYAEAAAAVATVPDDYQYQVVSGFTTPDGTTGPGGMRLLWRFLSASDADSAFYYKKKPGTPSIGDNEGGNGLNYRSSGDPRTVVKNIGTDVFGITLYLSGKYPTLSQTALLTVADGIEARLIEAEAALDAQDHSTWLTKLNHLRQTAWSRIKDCSAGGACTNAMSGPLPDLTDPGTDAQRVDLLFRERAFWLYLTGHRQGDLRRLVREYSRHPNTVFPFGPYQGAGALYVPVYGNQVIAEVPQAEIQLNDRYTGCLSVSA